ncbi:hypothetical protein CAEBREN_06697 [Caenorhabditis brenneri]|uniref:Rho-GAP domain-containing protein n=1 Tax=Caenorhabditis brenneri TaxID=135651 RepID=G0M9B5_CAEBE|nr:hypothetical protein CAEBREN_06697 [Caenorhabditis brenneri]
MEQNDFRVVASSSVYRKGSTAGGVGQNANRYRYTLGEVTSANITLDVNVGTGWTRIRLKEVPKFLIHAFNTISKNGMSTDGIFRREGNSARLSRIEVQDYYRGQCEISANYTVIDVCSMVKRFLRDLKPTLLHSEEFRARLVKKAMQARISNCFVMTRDEMAELFYKDHVKEQRFQSLLSDVHLSTLGYVMRQLNRISHYHEQHKMTIDNLSTVFVASVFGDGIHLQKKSNQMRRGSKDDMLATKQDNDVNSAAVNLLITNANLIGIPPDHYVSSSAMMLRSSSAMPRCMSSGYETGSSDPDCMSTKTTSTVADNKPGPSSFIYRRDSEAAHKIVTARKKGENSEKKKRSASFLPSFRDIRHRLTNMKRTKSPSPDRLMTGHASDAKFTDTTSSSDLLYTEDPLAHRKKVARNESNTMSTGSTASGRQSRSQQSRRVNTNAAPRLGSSHNSGNNNGNNNNSKPTIAKLFDSAETIIPSSGALRRVSASDQNADAIRYAVKNHLRLSNEQMSVTEFLISEHERDRRGEQSSHAHKIQKRNTMVLGEKTGRSQSGTQKNRRHTAPINNNRPRRNRPNTVGTGLPPNRKDSSMEEKENQADCETDDTLDPPTTLDHSEWLLEQKALEARSRRAGRKHKNSSAARNQSTDSMMVLNGSMAVDLDSTVVAVVEASLDAVKEESPQKNQSPVTVMMRKDVEELKKSKQFCDMATSPMVMTNTPKKNTSPSHHENGHVWVGTKQVVNVTPTPSIARRQSRARLSYSKANESGALEMPTKAATERRESSPLMSPILRHVTITNNSPPAQLITTSSPRTSITPKTHTLSPLVLKMESAESTPATTPPPVPRHSPPHLTPQTSRGSLEATRELKRISISGMPRRPPTPPSHPKMSNPFSPKLPIRSVTIDNGFELPSSSSSSSARDPAESSLFKLPQLPITKKVPPQLSPLARQSHASKSTLSVPNRANLRESKSIDEPTPLRSAPLHGASSSQLSPRSTDYFEFGKYTNVLRNASDEFSFPMSSRKPAIEPRPSVAIIRTNNCGLVKSRVNHFQEIEQLQRIDSAMSGRLSALSQTSLRSNDTHQSSSDRYSDISDLRHNLTSSDSTRSIPTDASTPNTPTASTSRVSDGQHF